MVTWVFLPCRWLRQGLVSYSFLLSFFILPAQPQDLVSYSFLKLGGSPNLFLSCDFFLLSSHNLHLLPHAWSDFDQTWSEWPVGKWLQKLCFVWPQRSCRGHRGQKCHFLQKMLLLLHVLLDFYDTWSEWPVNKWLQNVSLVWPQRSCRGHRGQEG